MTVGGREALTHGPQRSACEVNCPIKKTLAAPPLRLAWEPLGLQLLFPEAQVADCPLFHLVPRDVSGGLLLLDVSPDSARHTVRGSLA